MLAGDFAGVSMGGGELNYSLDAQDSLIPPHWPNPLKANLPASYAEVRRIKVQPNREDH